MISASAPGKLFIAGEYAVVEPGEPAILIAVDRFLTVHAKPAAGRSGTITSSHYGTPLTYACSSDGVNWSTPHHIDLVSLTIERMVLLASDRGIRPVTQDLTIVSDLDSPNGTKYGLGSSGAVTVALIEALNRVWEIGLSPIERFRAAMLITIQLSPHASGADLATQTLGGWVRYTSPDRATLRQMIEDQGFIHAFRTDWEGCSLERLPSPSGILCNVGWTASPAHTDTLVGARDRTGSPFRSFLSASRSAVDDLVMALQNDDTEGILRAYAGSRDALLMFDLETGGGIETTALRTLRKSSEKVGAVAKPSGAGGGDCGVVLSDMREDLSRMLEEWKHVGIERLPLTVTTQEDNNDW